MAAPLSEVRVAPFRLAAFWFGASFTWSLLATNLLPKDVQAMVGDADKGFRLGLVYSLVASISVVVPPMLGAWSDRSGERQRPLAIGAGFFVTGLSVMAVATHTFGYWAYVFGAMLTEFGSSVLHGSYAATMPELVPRAQQGQASGAIAVLRLTGTMLGVLTGVIVPIREVKFLVAACVLTMTLLLTLSAIRHVSPLRVPVPKLPASSVRVFLQPEYQNFRLVFISRFLAELGKDAVQPFLLYYLIDSVQRFELGGLRLERPELAQAVLLLTILVSAAISALIGGRITDRVGRVQVVCAGVLVQALAALGFAISKDYSLALACGALFGLGQGAFLAADWALVIAVLPSRSNFGRNMGIWHTSTVATGLFGGVFGRLLDATNRTTPGSGYGVLFGLSAVSLVLGAAIASRVKVR